jgi:hypothetical protein
MDKNINDRVTVLVNGNYVSGTVIEIYYKEDIKMYIIQFLDGSQMHISKDNIVS